MRDSGKKYLDRVTDGTYRLSQEGVDEINRREKIGYNKCFGAVLMFKIKSRSSEYAESFLILIRLLSNGVTFVGLKRFRKPKREVYDRISHLERCMIVVKK
jgi:hypothetical protein